MPHTGFKALRAGRISNDESSSGGQVSNVEGLYSARRELLCRTVYFKKSLSEANPSFDILRFCGL